MAEVRALATLKPLTRRIHRRGRLSHIPGRGQHDFANTPLVPLVIKGRVSN